MSITNTVVSQDYVANGVQVLFSIPFDYQLESEVVVYVDAVEQTVVADYTLTDSGGNPTTPNNATHVKFVLAPASLDIVEVLRNTALTQESDFLDSDPSSLELVEAAVDKLTQIVQELSSDLDNVISAADLVAIQSDISALEAAMALAEADILALQAADVAMTSRADGIEIDVAHLSLDLDTVEGDISTLQTNVGNNNSAIAVINATISAINIELLSLSNRLSALEIYFGGAGEVTILNNAGTTNIMSMVFNKDDYDAILIDFAIFRKTDANNRYSSGQIALVYSAAVNAWRIEKISEVLDYSGVVFAVTSAGQVSYTSSDIAGINYTGKMKYSIKKFEV